MSLMSSMSSMSFSEPSSVWAPCCSMLSAFLSQLVSSQKFALSVCDFSFQLKKIIPSTRLWAVLSFVFLDSVSEPVFCWGAGARGLFLRVVWLISQILTMVLVILFDWSSSIKRVVPICWFLQTRALLLASGHTHSENAPL